MAKNLFEDVMSDLCIFLEEDGFGIPKERIIWK